MKGTKVIALGLAANVFFTGAGVLTGTPVLYVVGGLCGLFAICWDIARGN